MPNQNQVRFPNDGGGAIVITSEEKAKHLKTEPIYIKGFGECNSHSSINYMPNMEKLEIACDRIIKFCDELI